MYHRVSPFNSFAEHGFSIPTGLVSHKPFPRVNTFLRSHKYWSYSYQPPFAIGFFYIPAYNQMAVARGCGVPPRQSGATMEAILKLPLRLS